jgi:putative nucleotidyltransferase with HDIG domain
LGKQQRTSQTIRFLPQVVAATLVVAVGPIAAIWALRREGVIDSPAAAIVLGTVLAFGASYVGAALWKSRRASGDLLFSELMLWGWLRRLWLERRIRSTVTLLEGLDGDTEVSRDRRAGLLLGLANALEAGDPYTSGHSRRVARHAERIAHRLGVPAHQVAKVRTAAALHDIGKLDTPRHILHKRGRLDDAEFAVIKQHPGRGGEIVATLGDPELSAIIRHHHERIDGSGYPDGLAGDAIPLAARVIAVADTFDAIISTRPYRPGAPHRKAIDVLTAEAGTQLDPAAVRAFTSVYSGRRPLSLWMVLTSAPERLASWLGGSFNTAAAASVARVMTATAVTTAAAASVVIAPSLSTSAPGLRSPQATLVAMARSAGQGTVRLTVSPPATSAQQMSGGSTAPAASSRPGSVPILAAGAVSPLTSSPGLGRGAANGPTRIVTSPTVPGSATQITVSPAASPATTPTATVVPGPSTTPSSSGNGKSSGGNGQNGGSSGQSSHGNGQQKQSGGSSSTSGGSSGGASTSHSNAGGNGNAGGAQGNTGGGGSSSQGAGNGGQSSGAQSTGSGSTTSSSNAGGNGHGDGNAGGNGNPNAGGNGNGQANGHST